MWQCKNMMTLFAVASSLLPCFVCYWRHTYSLVRRSVHKGQRMYDNPIMYTTQTPSSGEKEPSAHKVLFPIHCVTDPAHTQIGSDPWLSTNPRLVQLLFPSWSFCLNASLTVSAAENIWAPKSYFHLHLVPPVRLSQLPVPCHMYSRMDLEQGISRWKVF